MNLYVYFVSTLFRVFIVCYHILFSFIIQSSYFISGFSAGNMSSYIGIAIFLYAVFCYGNAT